MKLRLFLLLLTFSFSFAQGSSNDQFLQEIATVFTPDDGLPETAFSELRPGESGNIIAYSAGGEFIYEGGRWKISSKTSSDPAKVKKDFKEQLIN